MTTTVFCVPPSVFSLLFRHEKFLEERGNSTRVVLAKLFIRLTPEAPREIPMSEWEHIFKGEAVDLNRILSSLHCVTTDPERKASIGDTEISIGSTETKQKVETSSEWSTAWRSASRAIGFVFEHRERELYEYGDYIERLFAAK